MGLGNGAIVHEEACPELADRGRHTFGEEGLLPEVLPIGSQEYPTRPILLEEDLRLYPVIWLPVNLNANRN
jgi:hypothetical protein